jgi:type II secretory pathway component PulJ
LNRRLANKTLPFGGQAALRRLATLSIPVMQKSFSRHCGFTFTETLVALVAGLIVVGSVTVYAVSAVRSNAQIVAGASLLQQMRRSLTLVAGEIRRAGYYDDAAQFAHAAAGQSDMPVIRSRSCIIVRYDSNGAVFRGYRHAERGRVGVIQSVSSRGVEPDCIAPASNGGWRDITDPSTINVQELSFAPALGAGACASTRGVAVISQVVDVRMKAAAVSSPAVTRTLSETMRVRNDIMAAGGCT